MTDHVTTSPACASPQVELQKSAPLQPGGIVGVSYHIASWFKRRWGGRLRSCDHTRVRALSARARNSAPTPRGHLHTAFPGARPLKPPPLHPPTHCRADPDTLWLHYEDMAADLPGAIKLIAEFLGIGTDDAGAAPRARPRPSPAPSLPPVHS